LCDEDVVKMVVEDAPSRLRELMEWGAIFDKTSKGNFSLGREGGHSQDRILHHQDLTGAEIERALIAQVDKTKNIQFLTHHFAIDLITEHQVKKRQTTVSEKITCYGAYVLDEKKNVVKTFAAKVTMLASGGNGQVYLTTTNPEVAT